MSPVVNNTVSSRMFERRPGFSDTLQSKLSKLPTALDLVNRMPECEPCSESLQKQLASGREEENSKMKILHERTLYDLCGFDDDKISQNREIVCYKIVRL
jgi:hypothetical protein